MKTNTLQCLRWATLLPMSALLIACQSSPQCVPWKDQQSSEAFRGLSVLDTSLHNAIGFVSRRVLREASGAPAVEIEVYNCSQRDIALGFKAQFRSSGGVSEAASAWKRVYLAPMASAVYLERAVDPASASVQVEVIDINRAQAGPGGSR